MGPNPMTDVLVRGKFGHRHAHRTPHDAGGRDWSDASTSI